MRFTVRDLLDDAIPRLRDQGVETPRLDAELLLAHALRARRLDLHAHPHRVPTTEEWSRWQAALGRRLGREPVPYITGRIEFFGLTIRVGPGVLIPRPETESLVEAVLARVPENASILDVGTGSGCIAVALGHRLPRARIVALDPSPSALDIARANADTHGVSDRVRTVEGRFPGDVDRIRAGVHGPCGEGAPRPFDAVVANPPYIPSNEVDRLAPELREFEPRVALDGGPDGLEIIRPLLEVSPTLLRPGGFLAMEIAAGQAEAVLALVDPNPSWRDPAVIPDLAGIPRVLVARRGD